MAGKELNVPPEQSSFLTVSSSRVRVDSVFTDNESDDNSVPVMPHLISVNPTPHEVQSSLNLALRNPESETNTKSPGEMKYGRTQPRTKHTANIPKAVYPPAIKVTTLGSPQSAHTLSRDRNSRKHFPSSSSTGSSGTKSRVTGGSYRPSSSQVVVASAGSSYYFVSSRRIPLDLLFVLHLVIICMDTLREISLLLGSRSRTRSPKTEYTVLS